MSTYFNFDLLPRTRVYNFLILYLNLLLRFFDFYFLMNNLCTTSLSMENGYTYISLCDSYFKLLHVALHILDFFNKSCTCPKESMVSVRSILTGNLNNACTVNMLIVIADVGPSVERHINRSAVQKSTPS